MPLTFPSSFTTQDQTGLRWPAYVFLLLVCVAFFTPGLVNLPLFDRDEPRFAQASKQMIESGNYLDIRYQDEKRYKKPVGIYWLQTGSVKLFNPDHIDQIWAYRVPSQVGATIAVLMVAALGALLFGPLAGFIAALMLASTLILNVEARLAKTDAMLLACVVTAQYALVRAYLGMTKSGWSNALLFWSAQAVAFLIKGPILLLITAGTMLVLRYWQPKQDITRPTLAWFKSLKPFFGVPFALALIAPWFLAIIQLSQGEFMRESAGHDLLSKLWQGQDRGKIPPGVHLLAAPAVYFPAALLVILALPDLWHNRHDPKIKFLLGWALPAWLVFEAALTKLPHYTLPLFPALAIAAAKYLLDGFPQLGQNGKRWVAFAAAFTTIAVGAVLAFGTPLLQQLQNEQLQFVTILAGLVLLVGLAWSLALLAQRKAQGVLILCIATLIFYAGTFGQLLPGLKNFWHARDVVQVAKSAQTCPVLKLASNDYAEPSLVFQAGTDTYLAVNGKAVAAAMQADPCVFGLVSVKARSDFLSAFKDEVPDVLQKFSGYNLGSGKVVDLTLYRPLSP